jgi:hypothetical protein
MNSSLKQTLFLAVAGLAPTLWGGSINVYINQPGVNGESSPIAGSTTATFDAVTAGKYSSLTTSIGTYTSAGKFQIQAADQFSGAGGTSYFVFGSQSGSAAPVTLTFASPQNYFGMWWSAGDANNGITLYNNGVALARFSTATVLSILNTGVAPSTVQAINGSSYNKSSYFGNPENGQDSGEPFAYLMFFGNGLQFNQVVFDNSGTTGTGFESDNHSIYSGALTVPGTSVFVQQIATPEPATAGFLVLSFALLIIAGRKRTCR